MLKCRSNGVLSNHILAAVKRTHTAFTHSVGQDATDVLVFEKRLEHKIINLQVCLAHRLVDKNDRFLNRLEDRILQFLPVDVWSDFKSRNKISYNKQFHLVKNTNINKFNRLLMSQSLNFKTEEKWIKNLSEVNIPGDVKKFLALGPKFALPVAKGDLSIVHLLADVESIVSKVDVEHRNLVTAQNANIITNFVLKDHNKFNKFNLLYNKTRKFIKDNPNLYILRADKGNVTVVMNKTHYIDLSKESLTDDRYYVRFERDPCSTIQQKANRIISNLKSKQYIQPEDAKRLTIYNSVTPRFYALPKIHKPTLSVRPIVSSINSPNSGISQLVARILTEAYDNDNRYFIKDSFDLARLLQNTPIPDNHILISLDVTSLFTNIPRDLVKTIVRSKWQTIRQHTDVPLEDFLDLLDFLFDTVFFIFDQDYYKQIFGTPMGASVSPILAQYVMDELLDCCLSKLPFQIPIIKKYVDDMFCVVPRGTEDEILTVFNGFNPFLQFTTEIEKDNSIPFLDTRIVRHNNTLILDWYRKPTNSGRYLNYLSNHKEKMKVNLVLGLKNRIHKISHESFFNKNLKLLFDILKKNSYPDSLLRRLLFSDPMARSSATRNPTDRDDVTQVAYAVLPYIEHISPRIINTFKDFNFKFALKNIKTVDRLFTKTKDPVPTLERSAVVYNIKCSDCQLEYIGQTSQTLKSRLTAHRSDIRREKKSCAMAEHSITTNHLPNYDDVSILDHSNSYKKRTFMEMARISQNPNAMNKRSDIANLSNIYSYLLHLDNNKNPPNNSNSSTGLS